MTIWVLNTDHYRARCFDYDAHHATLQEVSDLLNPSARNTIDDQRGHGFDGAGGTRHGMQPRTQPHQHDDAQFARAIAEYLRSEQAAGHFDQLQLVAAPDWLGELRKALPETVRRTLTEPLQKNLAKASTDELLQQLKVHAHH